MRKIILAIALVLVARAADAQTSLTADRIYLGATGCALRTGAGVPTGGTACDFYFDTATGHVWVNHAGTWIDISTRTPTFQTVTSTTKLTTPLIDTASGPLALAPASGTIEPLANLGASFGSPTKKFLALHLGELWAESLVAQDVLATIGGRVIIAPTTMLTADLAPAATAITVKANTLQNGDRVFLQSAPGGVPQMEWMNVTSAASGSAGAYTYTVTRNVDGSGANAWVGGDAVVDTGTVGKGFIDLYALSGVLTGFGPTIVGNVRTGTAFNAYAPRWAIGNLNGLYGAFTDRYGFGAGNAAGAYVYVDDANGIVMGGPLGLRVQITPAGDATFIGDGGGVTNINGGNITTGSVTADKIAADAITADKIAAGAVTADELAAGAVTSAKIASGTGSNMIRNSECRASAADWSLFDGTGLGPGTVGFNPGTFWSMNNEPGVCYWFANGTPANGTQTIAYYTPSGGTGVSVLAGHRYEASVYLGSAAGSGPLAPAPFVFLQFLDLSGAAIGGVGQGNACSVAAGNDFNAWCRSGIIALAPAGSRFVRVGVQQNYIGTTGSPYTTTVRWYLGEAKPNQTELSDWSPAGATEIIGGLIKTDTLDARVIQANAITADKIAAGAITADKITAGTITGDKIAADAITSAHIAAGTIVASDIATGTITADRLNVTALSAITANLGSVTAGSMSAVSITGGTISGTTITGVNISASSTITGGTISGTTITGVTVSGSTITAGGGAVTLDGSGITVANGDSNANARIKLGSVSLWGGGSSNLSSDGNFDIGAIRAHQAVDFEKTAHVYQTLQVDGVSTMGNYISLNGSVNYAANGGSLYWTGVNPLFGTGATMSFDGGCRCLIYNSSSARFKENIRPWSAPDPLAILALPLSRFDFRNEPGVVMPSKDHVGFTVEDLVKIAPDAVVRDAQGRPESFYSDTLDTYLLAALKAVNARVTRIDGLTARTSSVEALNARIAALEKKIAALEAAARKKDP